MKKIFYVLLIALMATSCNSKKSEYNPYAIKETAKKDVEKNAFEVSFKKTASNVKTIHIKLNNTNGYDAIFDTGCSGLLISSLEFTDLVKAGTIATSDYIGEENSSIANGAVVKTPLYNIREINLVDKKGKVHTIRDVKAAVVDNMAADVLIGSAVIDNFAKKSYTVDLSKKVIRFE